MVLYNTSPLSMLSWVVLILGSVISVSSVSWSGIWLGIELNMFSLLVFINSVTCYHVEPGVNYFVIQSVGSFFSIMGFIVCSWTYEMESIILVIIGLFINVGFFPFHCWVPIVVSECRWLASFLVLSWQNIAPLILLLVFSSSLVIIISGSLMALLGGLGGLNQHSTRIISAYSSFVHSSWMLVSLIDSFWLFILYFLFYSTSLAVFFYSCSNAGNNNINSGYISFLSLISLFILSGVPPFFGFFVNILVMLSCPHFFIVFCIIGSVISLKYYLTFIFSFFFNSVHNVKYSSLSADIFIFLGLSLNFVGASGVMSLIIV